MAIVAMLLGLWRILRGRLCLQTPKKDRAGWFQDLATVSTTTRVRDHSNDAVARHVWSIISAWGLEAKGVGEK